MLLSIPRTYPDYSLPWVLADHFLTAEISGKQAIPVVIDGETIRPPKFGFSMLGPQELSSFASDDRAQLIFIVDSIPLQSKTRLNFLIEEVRRYPTAKYIFITRGDPNLLIESEFVGKVSAHIYEICDISFIEIAHFIQKNFSMNGSEAEVIAFRLWKTFDDFDLAAHPTYFAGIPRETLSALLQANRRAELIQLAVDGFLTFVVVDDRADISLSRTTRSRFLRKLSAALNVQKQTFTQERLIAFTSDFASKYDFEIDPLAFIRSFVDKGILHFEGGTLRFSLPFIERYLLAVELKEDDGLALTYFQLRDSNFDLITFDLYSELGASEKLVERLVKAMERCLSDLHSADRPGHILLTDEIRLSLLGQPERLKALQQRVKRAVDDVQSNRSDREGKQQILDITNRIREKAARRSSEAAEREEKFDSAEIENLGFGMQAWFIGTVLLGSGAEHLDGKTKQHLVKTLIQLAAVILDGWTRRFAAVDFELIKKEITSPEAIADFVSGAGVPVKTPEEAVRLIDSLADVLEFALVSEPFRRVVHQLCELARHRVLAASLEKTNVDKLIERILLRTWLSDIDTKRGAAGLKEVIRELPAAPFLRFNLATHFLTRVYWSHWKVEDRLILLDAADDAIKPIEISINKPQLKRYIEHNTGDKGEPENSSHQP